MTRKDFYFMAAIVATLFLYFPEVFFLKLGFFSGDHRVQHYPWAVFYAEGLKQFKLPWWTTFFHCGFPLLAEGQVGAFYPLNVFFYFFFPPTFAYSYNILANYLLGALFFYGYLRSLKLSPWASFFGAFIYLFGTAQGGYYYNVISLKVLIWLPATFYLADEILERGRKSRVLWLGPVIAFQIFGGYLQYALYSVLFTSMYFIWFSLRKLREGKSLREFLKDTALLTTSLLLGCLIALPQLGSTLELSTFSKRYSYPEEFAYVGSMNPLALATLFFPHWDGFLGSEIYLGVTGLFFLIVSLRSKKQPKEVFFLVMGLVALALALGQFSPLYVALIKMTHFSGFRIPTKFIFFVAFSFSVLCGYGFEKWMLGRGSGKERSHAYQIFSGLCALGIAGPFLAQEILGRYSAGIKTLLRGYIERHFIHSAVHPWPLEEYLARVDTFYDGVLKMVSTKDPWNLAFLAFILLGWLLVTASHSSKKASRTAFSAGFALISFLNFYPYGFTTIKGNYETYRFIDRPSRIVDFLKQDREVFRIQRVYSSLSSFEKLPLPPHVNMLYGLTLTGAYSPFVFADYYELFRGLGDVNDSHQRLLMSEEGLEKGRSLLNFLNVKYLLSDRELTHKGLVKVMEEGESFLYENPRRLPRAFFVKNLEDLAGEDEEYGPAGIAAYEQDRLELEVEAKGHGYLVTSEIAFPGWQVTVDGEKTQLIKARKSFRAVEIKSEGKHRVRFFYDPLWRKFNFLPFAGPFVCGLAPLLWENKKSLRPSQILFAVWMLFILLSYFLLFLIPEWRRGT